MLVQDTRPAVRFGVPAKALTPFISTYYIVEMVLPAGRAVDDLLHPEWANLRFLLSGDWTTQARDRLDDARVDPRLHAPLYGPTSRALRVRTGGGMMVGVGLLPTAWAALTGSPASDLADGVRPQEQVFGREPTEALLHDLRTAPDDGAIFARLDAFLAVRLAGADEHVVEAVAHAHALLLDPTLGSVGDWASRLRLSERQVRRFSLRHFGFGPKLLLRRQRFLRTLSAQRQQLGRPWSSLIDPSYGDQSQFVRDFHDFMGMAPSAYFSLPRELLDPAARARVDIFGQPFQALHPAASAP